MSDRSEYTFRQTMVGWLVITFFVCGVASSAFGAAYGVMQWEMANRVSMAIAAFCAVAFAGSFIAALAVFQRSEASGPTQEQTKP